MGVTLLGREQERRQIERLLGAARNRRGAALLVTGEPGIGKSTLLGSATAGMTSATRLAIDGYEAESSIPFAGIDRLLIPVRPLVGALPARLRTAVGIAIGSASGAPPDRSLVGLGVLGLLSAAAEGATVLCVVDDAHLLDSESLEVLAFVARRLEAEPIALVLAGRSDESLESRLAGIPTLELGGLPPDAGVRLLVASSPVDVDPVAAAQIVAATGGNPLALTDLAHELTAKQLAETTFAVEPIPIGHHLEAHYLRHIRQLSAEAQQWLVVAAADSTADLTLVRAAMAALGQTGTADHLADEAEAAGLIELRTASLAFRHPLVRSAAYNAAHGPQRRRVHRALATAAEDMGLVELEAWHAARATLGTDPVVAERLERVADRAGERGGFASRARVLHQAAHLTPAGALRSTRLVGAAEAALAAGAARLASTLLDEVDEDEADRVTIGRLVTTRASISIFVGDPDLTTSAAEMLRAAELFHGIDPDLEQQALIRAFDFVLPPERATRGTTLPELGHRLAAGAELQEGVASTILRGLSALVLLPRDQAVPALRCALDVFDAMGPEDLLRYGATSVALASALWDQDARRTHVRRIADAARDAGSLQQMDNALWTLSLAEVTGGSPRRGAAAMEQVRELRRANGHDAEHVINVSLLAWAGAPVDQVAAIAEGAAAMGYDGVRSAGHAALAARHLSEGRPAEAYALLHPLAADPFLHVTSLYDADLVEAAVRCGRTDAAREGVERLDGVAAATGSRWARGLAARARGLLDEDDAEDAFRRSIAELEATPLEAERARSHLVYGEWLRRRRRRREAREQLEAARRLFAQIDAPTFAARATTELQALGERAAGAESGRAVGPSDTLTAQELVVARFAADGHTNAEIAASMFLSANTIDYHLRKVFQKLGISSRRQLRDHLGPT
ncbi:AAA family ATPase [Iamia majanohamensis]|uniref:AAA family ATPase n=1 Tax=Iamia majanohamensis TaxID=467976 RepID=A0AAF0BVQ5_9ACTN|nr:LuxR family transcriptional regulator [Iamia majanohamensis]WCO67015.1 AAA family ATPase [Iamia majanohamensis]